MGTFLFSRVGGGGIVPVGHIRKFDLERSKKHLILE